MEVRQPNPFLPESVWFSRVPFQLYFALPLAKSICLAADMTDGVWSLIAVHKQVFYYNVAAVNFACTLSAVKFVNKQMSFTKIDDLSSVKYVFSSLLVGKVEKENSLIVYWMSTTRYT